MTTQFTRLTLKLGASVMITGAALLSVSSLHSSNESFGRLQTFARTRVASADPAIMHHWEGAPAQTASADPAIMHHWEGAPAQTASADPAIMHHWEGAPAQTASADPAIMHHWA